MSTVPIAAGNAHTCAALTDGTVECWGANSFGQLGDATNDDSSTPVLVDGITTATAITAGGDHSCALLDDGTLRCWGRNLSGELGDGTGIDSNTPVPVSGITSAMGIAAGNRHACALLADGTLSCWGEGSLGRLGNGLPGGSDFPVAVVGIATATAVAAGFEHTCAALADGTLRCWGSHGSGQLGNGTTGGGSFSTPGPVSGITAATSVSAGGAHTCALLSDGALQCWGANASGELGLGVVSGPESCGVANVPCSNTPVLAGGIGTAAVVAGKNSTCALSADGTLGCWGQNSSGEHGNGTVTGSTTPASANGVTGISTATAISSSFFYACALLAVGSVKCWGTGAHGELGDGTTGSLQQCSQFGCSTTPVTVSGITTATGVSVGESFSCAVLSDGTVRCWGINTFGQLGNGTNSGPGTCNTVACSSTPVQVSGITTATAVSAGRINACALLADRSIRCWGHNGNGELGNGSSTGPDSCNGNPCSTTPVPVSGIASATAVSASGFEHLCALLADGTVKCWGSNNRGELGSGTNSGPDLCAGPCSTTPVGVGGITTARAISAGGSHTCAVLLDGTVKCWGFSSDGGLGNGTTVGSGCFMQCSPPVSAVGITRATSISLSEQHACVVSSDGTAKCWGQNAFGEFGNGTSGALSATPTAVSGFADAIPAVVWSSFDPSIAAIGTNSIAAGRSEGTTLVTASAANFDVSGNTPLAVPEPATMLGTSAALSTLAMLAGAPRRRRL